MTQIQHDIASALPSGRWAGFFFRDGEPHEVELVLEFGEESFEGRGRDANGSFSLEGSLDLQTREASFSRLHEDEECSYRGFFDGTVEGIWGINAEPGEGRRGFHIWPE